MTIDLRLPLGALFVLVGVVLIVCGLVSGPAIYTRSLGIDINLWWGVVLALFGAVVFAIAYVDRRRER